MPLPGAADQGGIVEFFAPDIGQGRFFLLYAHIIWAGQAREVMNDEVIQ